MDAKDVLPIIFERANATQLIWNILLLTIAGIGTVRATLSDFSANKTVKLCLTALYLLVAIPNCRTLQAIAEERNEVIKAFKHLNSFNGREYVIGLPALAEPDSYGAILSYHILIGIAVMALIWIQDLPDSIKKRIP